MNKELYNNLLNKLIIECGNWENIYKIVDSYENHQWNNRLSNIVTERNIKENNKEDSFKEIQKKWWWSRKNIENKYENNEIDEVTKNE